MKKTSKIYVAGHRGMVGSAIMRKLEHSSYNNIIVRTHKELDLVNQKAVNEFFKKEKPEYVFLAAAKVGGILANNTYPADFIYNNLMIEANIVHAAYENNVKKLLFLGSSCIYPQLAPQPIKEEHLLTGLLEIANEAYAIAKIAGLKLCKYYNEQYNTNFISVMPTNLFGPNDNYDLENSHVMAALIRKFTEAKKNNAKEVVVWGTGNPRREFLYVDDLADVALHLMKKYNAKDIGDFVNVGSGKDISIKELAELIRDIVEFKGNIIYDTSKPDGTPRKILDISKLTALGRQSKYNSNVYIKKVCVDYISEYINQPE